MSEARIPALHGLHFPGGTDLELQSVSQWKASGRFGFLPASIVGIIGLLGTLLAGCERAEIRAYSVPKDPLPPSVVAYLSTTNTAPVKPQWDVPAGWEEQPASNLILARYSVKDASLGVATVTISSFPGDVGGTLANINRWRGELGLPAIGQDGLEKVITTIDLQGNPATLVDMVSSQPGEDQPGAKRLVVVILERQGQTWFYKMLGPDALVSKQKAALLKFVESARYSHAA